MRARAGTLLLIMFCGCHRDAAVVVEEGAPSPGVLEGRTYRNESFGLRVTFPEDWSIEPGASLTRNATLTTTETLVVGLPVAGGPTGVGLRAVNKRFLGGSHFADEVRKSMRSTQEMRIVVKEPYTERIGARDAHCVDVDGYIHGRSPGWKMCAVTFGAWSLQIQASWFDDAERVAVLAVLAKVELAPRAGP